MQVDSSRVAPIVELLHPRVRPSFDFVDTGRTRCFRSGLSSIRGCSLNSLYSHDLARQGQADHEGRWVVLDRPADPELAQRRLAGLRAAPHRHSAAGIIGVQPVQRLAQILHALETERSVAPGAGPLAQDDLAQVHPVRDRHVRGRGHSLRHRQHDRRGGWREFAIEGRQAAAWSSDGAPRRAASSAGRCSRASSVSFTAAAVWAALQAFRTSAPTSRPSRP